MKVVFFTEGGKNKGFGHIVRCIALAEKLLLDGADVHMIVDCDASCKNIFKNISYEFCEWHSLDALHERAISCDIVIVDSYVAKQEYINRLKTLKAKLFFFDDYGRLEYPRGFVLNYAPCLDTRIYTDKNISYLLGDEFAVLRSEFARKKTFLSKKTHRAVVMVGAADTSFVSAEILNLLLKRSIKSISLITSKANKKLNRLKRDFAPFGVEFLVSVGANRVAKTIFLSDFAVTSCSQSMLEIASIGVPFVSIKTEQNQNYYCDKKTINVSDKHFVEKLQKSLFEVRRLSSKRKIYNGTKKISSILHALTEDVKTQSFLFKNFTNLDKSEQDAVLIMRNHTNVRRFMFGSDEIDAQSHYDFIESLRAKEDRVYFAVYQESVLVGAIYLSEIDYVRKNAKLGIYKNQSIDFKNTHAVLEDFLSSVCDKLFVKTLLLEVLEVNEKAINFYLKNNFYITKQNKNVLLMEHRLG